MRKQLCDSYLPTPLWPQTLIFPKGKPKLIYLDQKDWISFAQVLTGHRQGIQYRELFETCCTAVQSQTALFPISMFTLIELQQGSYRHRAELTKVIELLSRFICVCPPAVVIRHEFEVVLDCLVGPRPQPIPHVNYLGHGVFHSAGAFSHPMEQDPYWMEKLVAGPAPEEEKELRDRGWDPGKMLSDYKEEAAYECCQANTFRKALPKRGHEKLDEWRRNAIAARVFICEINTIVEKCCNARDLCLQKIFDPENGRADFRHATDAMPWLDCSISLRSSIHSDMTHLWSENDVIDIKSLATTIPYCDVVVTDRKMRHHVSKCRLPERYATVVLAKLRDLEKHL